MTFLIPNLSFLICLLTTSAISSINTTNEYESGGKLQADRLYVPACAYIGLFITPHKQGDFV